MALKDWFNKKKEGDDTLIDSNVCPNCWGRQEYSGAIYEAAENRRIDLQKDDPNRQAFIQNFVIKHIEGITLKEDGDEVVCASCKVRYKKKA